MTDEEDNLLLQQAWHARNEIYQDLFGDHAYCSPKEYIAPTSPIPGFKRTSRLSQDNMFQSSMAGQRIPVLSYAPNDSRPYWMHVTSGLSNPWFQIEPNEVSGFGSELIIKSNKDARWAIQLLRRMAYYILSYTGTLSPGKILSMNEPITKGNSQINNILVWYADEAPDCWYQLPSGGFGLFSTIGITEDECKFAESVNDYGPWCIQQVLRQTGVGQITDPHRASVMKNENINSVLDSVKAYARNFKEMT